MEKKIVKLMERGYNLAINIPTEWKEKDKLEKGKSVELTRIGKREYKVKI